MEALIFTVLLSHVVAALAQADQCQVILINMGSYLLARYIFLLSLFQLDVPSAACSVMKPLTNSDSSPCVALPWLEVGVACFYAFAF